MLRWRQRRWTVTVMISIESFICVPQRKRRKATRIHGDSEASAQFARGCFAPLSSDSEDELDDFLATGLTEFMRGDGHCQWGLTALQVHHQMLWVSS